ncbi:MAG TPA: peptidoglycan binding domain-containing protein, partial [Thermoleophilaceae bacterium]
MRQRSFIALAAALAVLLVGAVAVYAYDSSTDDQIADGVMAGGIDVGGMSRADARDKLRHELGLRLNRPLHAVYKHKKYKLSPADVKVRIDADGMSRRAVERSRHGNAVSRTIRGLFGGSVKADVPVRIRYDRAAVARLVKRVDKGVTRPARDASIDFSTGVLKKVKPRNGRTVQKAAH